MEAIIVLSEVAMKVVNTLESAISKTKNGITFIAVNDYTNSANEVSNNLINVGIKYENQKLKDIEYLKTLDIQSISFHSSLIDIEKARIALIEAFLKPNENRSNGQKNAYYHINSAIKVHIESGEVMIYGYRENKKVISEGIYKEVKSSSLTIAKNELRRLLKTSKFKYFKLSNLETLKANKETLEF
jgi:hypothetical protein